MSAQAPVPDFEPPLASVTRIVKSALPSNIMLTKDARAAFTRAAGVFIFYLTHCANEFCQDNNRSTISSTDVRNALKELDFDDFEAPIEEFLEFFKAQEKAHKQQRQRHKDEAHNDSEDEDGIQVNDKDDGDAARADAADEADMPEA